MVYGTYKELVTGAFVNQRSHHWGASHCMYSVYIYIHTIIYIENDGKPMDLGIHYVQTNPVRP